MPALTVVSDLANPIELRSGEPGVEVHKDCVYVPVDGRYVWWEDRGWGIYDSAGMLIEAAAYYRGPGKRLAGQNPTCVADIADAPYAPGETYFYVANMIDHFGHFLISSMSRLWALPRYGLQSLPMLGHGAGVPEGWFSHRFIRTLMGAAGVFQEDFATFQRPVRLRELIVARPSLEEHNFGYRLHAEAAHRWGDRLVKAQDLSSLHDMVYLSKHRLSGAVTALSNELELVAALEAAGVRIVCPEQLSFPEQIAVFRSSKVVLGQAGSAFHGSILSAPRHDQTLIGILLGPQVGSNLALIDQVNQNRARYVLVDGERVQAPNINHAFRIADPVRTARDLIDFAKSV